MAVSTPQPAQKNGGLFNRFLATVEYLGNMLPHPITLFAMFCVAIIVFSGIADWFGLSAIDPRPEGAKGRDPDGVIEVVSLLSAEGLQKIVTGLVTNFTGFAPLGTVLVALLGVSVAEHSGLLSAAMRGMVMGASKRLVTFMVVFAALSLADDNAKSLPADLDTQSFEPLMMFERRPPSECEQTATSRIQYCQV